MSRATLDLRAWRGIDNVSDPERVRSVPSKEESRMDLTAAVNVDISDGGAISRRAGQELVVAGATHSLWSNDETCLYVKDGTMYVLDINLASTAVAAGLSSDPVSYVEVNGRIYHANGRTAAVVDGGRVRSWGMRLSDINVAAAASFGSMEEGVYLFSATFLRADGQESGAPMASRIDLGANSGIAFSWTVPDDLTITGIALYVSQPNGEELYQAAVVDVEQGTYLYTGGPRSMLLSTQWYDAPPVGSTLVLHRGRIYIAVQDLIYATAPLGYEYCDLRDYRAIDGTQIRVLAAVQGGLFVGTARNVYFLSGQDFKDTTLTHLLECGAVKGSLVMADGGIVTGDAALSGQQVALFATEQGIMLGMPDGSLRNYTLNRYNMVTAAEGAAILKTGTATQYLLSLKEQ